MHRPLRVRFALDGTGVYYDPHEPPTLDGIMAAAFCRWHVHGEPPARDEQPFDVPLPLDRWEMSNTWGWRASALFPEEDHGESMQWWRKRFRADRVERTVGSPNLTNSTYRDWNMPLPLLLTPALVGYCVGDRREIRHELRRSIRYVGKKRAHGRGRIVDIQVEEWLEDWSCERDGHATRWMPRDGGTRLVRPRPPYWSSVGRVGCCEIGEATCAAQSEPADTGGHHHPDHPPASGRSV